MTITLPSVTVACSVLMVAVVVDHVVVVLVRVVIVVVVVSAGLSVAAAAVVVEKTRSSLIFLPEFDPLASKHGHHKSYSTVPSVVSKVSASPSPHPV